MIADKTNSLASNHTILIRGQLVDLSYPRVMGVLNVTPDSFFEGSRVQEHDLLKAAEKMLSEGATFLDIGGYSSRPGAADISEQEELQRVVPSINLLAKKFPEAILSVDSFRSRVAQEAVAAGAHLVNDISAGALDPDMLSVVGNLNVPYIAMHMRGTPQTMTEHTNYDDLLLEIIQYFSAVLQRARAASIHDVLIDPGFGFAKTIDQNFTVLKNLRLFSELSCPMVIGLSRKSTIYKTLKTTPDNALNGTTVLNTIALLGGAHILRVHDVKEAVEVVSLIRQLRQP